MSFLTKTRTSLLRTTRAKIQATKPSTTIKSSPSKSTPSKSAFSTSVFALPPPRPLAKQRFESTAGVVESGFLVVGLGVMGALYERANRVVEEVEEGEYVESMEDRGVHEWIRPFDFIVGEDEVQVEDGRVEEDGE